MTNRFGVISEGDQSEDFLLVELLSDFLELSLDLLEDSLAFLSAAAPLL